MKKGDPTKYPAFQSTLKNLLSKRAGKKAKTEKTKNNPEVENRKSDPLQSLANPCCQSDEKRGGRSHSQADHSIGWSDPICGADYGSAQQRSHTAAFSGRCSPMPWREPNSEMEAAE